MDSTSNMADPTALASIIGDLVTVAVAYLATHLLKRFVKRKSFADRVRRFLPLFSVFVGVLVQVMIHTIFTGGTWGQALLRGIYSGAGAVAAQNLYKKTVKGDLSQAPTPEG